MVPDGPVSKEGSGSYRDLPRAADGTKRELSGVSMLDCRAAGKIDQHQALGHLLPPPGGADMKRNSVTKAYLPRDYGLLRSVTCGESKVQSPRSNVVPS